jgi:diacylglycerol kinase (ATP)
LTQPPFGKKVVRFIVNPVSGNGRTRRILPHLIDIAKKLGVRFDLQLTKAPEHATELANDPSDEFDIMIAVGGDGTINEVATGALKSKKTIGVVPTGNGNDFIRALGKLKNLRDYIHRAVSGKVKLIDVGSVHVDNKEFFFVNGLGIGFDAEVARETANIHRLRGMARYLYAVMKTLSRYKAIPMRIEFDQNLIEQKTFLVAIRNGISSGGGFLLTPNALIDDGSLDACIVSEVSVVRVVHLLPQVLAGAHGKYREVTMAKMKQIKVQSEKPVSIHRDGEVSPKRASEIDVHIMPQSLKIIF